MNIKHNVTKSIDNLLELSGELSWITDGKKQMLKDLTFEIIFGYDDLDRSIELLLREYEIKDEIREKILKLLKNNKNG